MKTLFDPMRGAAVVVCVSLLAACASQPPQAASASTKKAPPLTIDEMQQIITGAARLNRHCLDEEAPTGLYIIRLSIRPDGGVSEATARRAPTRAEDPATYSGVPRYIDAGAGTPQNGVTRCLANALQEIRFRRFSGPEVGFDHPVVVEKLPPSEPKSELDRCEQDSDCVFRPRRRCTCPPCGCPTCTPRWRRAMNREALQGQRERWQKERKRCGRLRRRRLIAKRRGAASKRCPSCEPVRRQLGTRALCIDGQCTVR